MISTVLVVDYNLLNETKTKKPSQAQEKQNLVDLMDLLLEQAGLEITFTEREFTPGLPCWLVGGSSEFSSGLEWWLLGV